MIAAERLAEHTKRLPSLSVPHAPQDGKSVPFMMPRPPSAPSPDVPQPGDTHRVPDDLPVSPRTATSLTAPQGPTTSGPSALPTTAAIPRTLVDQSRAPTTSLPLHQRLRQHTELKDRHSPLPGWLALPDGSHNPSQTNCPATRHHANLPG